MFSYKDIQWVRNVKREGGENWAYFDDDKDEMILHWSTFYTHKPTHAMTPKVGDLVVLFQKVNANNQVCFTHLLTPLDNIEHDLIKTIPKHRWGRKMKVLARTKEFVKPLNFDLRAVNQGHTYSVELLDKKNEKETIQKRLWNGFKPFFNNEAYGKYIDEIYANVVDEAVDDIEAIEGAWNYAMHRFRERDRTLVNKKKTTTPLVCECCTFDFSKTYPDLGNGFIECHHKIPIHRGERITEIKDLALVCSNCHRMLHRKNKNNDYYTVEELKDIIKNNNE
jgi:hypothetical protein